MRCAESTCGGAADADEDEADVEGLLGNSGTLGSNRVEACKLDEDVHVGISNKRL